MSIKRIKDVVLTIITYIAVLIIVSPIFWLISVSFTPLTVTPYPPYVVPFLQYPIDFESWNLIFQGRAGITAAAVELRDSFINSLIIATGSSLLCLAIGLIAAYGLSRFRYERWKNKDIAFFIISYRMLPPAVFIIPYLIMFNALHLLDTHLAVIIVHTAINLPLITWLLRDYFRQIPVEIEEAGLVDGCSRLKTIISITLPLSAPGIIIAWLFAWIFSWNELILGLTLTLYNAKPFSVFLAGLINMHGIQWSDVCAKTVIAMIPPFILALVGQKYIVRGLTFGAVRG